MYSATSYSVDSEAGPTQNREYRPITIMSNVFKLLSRIVLSKVKPALMESRVISENQGAFGDNTVDAKELVLLDKVIQG